MASKSKQGSNGEESAMAALHEIREALLSVSDCTLDFGFRFGRTDDGVNVEVAPGYTTTWQSAAGIKSKEFAKRLKKMKARHPKERYYEEPRVTGSPAASRGEECRAVREQIMARYEQDKPTLQRLVLQHGIGKDWQASYQTEWDQHAKSVRGARDAHHINTYQAGVIANALTPPCPFGHFDALEAALLCDYVCTLCKADALRMIDELLAKVVAPLHPITLPLAKPSLRQARNTRERCLLVVAQAALEGTPLETHSAIALAADCDEKTVGRTTAGDIEKRDDGYHVTESSLQELRRKGLLPAQG